MPDPLSTHRENRFTGSCSLRSAYSVKQAVAGTASILDAIREAVIERREPGPEWHARYDTLIEALDPCRRHAAPLAGYLAQWADMGYVDIQVVRNLVSRFPHELRTELPLTGYTHLRLAQGMLAEHDGDPASANAHFDFVLSLGADAIPDRQLLALAHFWKARAQRHQGEIDLALIHTGHAREIAGDLGHKTMAAAIQVLEGWLWLDKEKPQRATEILREAEVVLRDTDDVFSMGSIHSALAGIAFHEGRYDLGLKHLSDVISCYGSRNPQHAAIAWALTRIAHARRRTAIRLARRVDHAAEQRRRVRRDTSDVTAVDSSCRRRIETLRAEAVAALAQAEEIYGLAVDDAGTCSVRVERGLLFLDCGDLEKAHVESREAWALAAASGIPVLKTEVRILQSLIEGADYDEEVDQDPSRHALRAHDYSKEALSLAESAGDHHLLARAHISEGLILCNSFFNDAEGAKECCQRAGALLPTGCHDHLWDEYQVLAARVLQTGNVDATLRKWTQGLVENKTFQQIVDEFAEMVIPGVWEREGRNISRVVAKLSISPKKVRRLLSRAGVKAPKG